MKYKTFKDFLMSKYEETYRGNYDNLIDRFEDYLCNLWDREDIVSLADKYAAIQKQEILEEIEKLLVNEETWVETKDGSKVNTAEFNNAPLNHLKQTLTK